MLYLDIPTADDYADLAARRGDIGVSLFLHTTPVTLETDTDRVQIKNLAKEAITQLEAVGADKRRVRALAEELDDLIDDDDFWRYQAQIADWQALYRTRLNEDRATTDLARAARAATFGAVASPLVDMDQTVHGTVDEADGTITDADAPGAESYGVADEVARRVLTSGGQVLAVRAQDMPVPGKPVAAILRSPL